MKEKKQHESIVINGSCHSNITIVNQDNEPVAVISPSEIITKNGYKVLFDVGDN